MAHRTEGGDAPPTFDMLRRGESPLARASDMHYAGMQATAIQVVAFDGSFHMSTSEQRAMPTTAGAQSADLTPAQAHDEDALDEALDESFPASDPVAVNISTPRGDKEKRDART